MFVGYNYTTHRILLGRNIFAIENLANPQLLPAAGARVTILPIRLENGSGAAARIVGEYDSNSDGQDECNHATRTALNGQGVVLVSILYISKLAMRL